MTCTRTSSRHAACGMTSRESVSYRVLQKLNRLVLQRAELIFCIGRDMLEHLVLARGTGTSDGIKVIPLWAIAREFNLAQGDQSAAIGIGFDGQAGRAVRGKHGTSPGNRTL